MSHNQFSSPIPDPETRPLVSVRIITYNQKEYIAKALDSVLSQEAAFSFEICIGEDGSDDGTAEICEEYAAKYPEIIRLFHRDRQDPGRNKYRLPRMHNFVETLRACRGKYIALLDGDDYWTDPLKLQKQVDFLEMNPEFILSCCQVKYVDENNEVTTEASGVLHDFTAQDFVKTNPVRTGSMLFRSNPEVISDFSLPAIMNVYIGDWPLSLLLLKHGPGHQHEEVMVAYRLHAESTWSSKPYSHTGSRIAATLHCLALSKVFDVSLSEKLFDSGTHYLMRACDTIEPDLWREFVSDLYTPCDIDFYPIYKLMELQVGLRKAYVDCEKYKSEKEEYRTSMSYKVGRKLLWPYRQLQKWMSLFTKAN